MRSRPVIIGYDGTPAAEQALRGAVPLLVPHAVLVVVVWEAGKAFDLATLPVSGFEPPPTLVDLRGGFALDRAVHEAAERAAQHGAALARAAGLDAQSLVVADEVTVADTLIRLAREYDSPAIVVGTHGLRPIGEVLLGSTSRDVVERAPCPVVVVRDRQRDHDL
jgi:nucleotide-binding universal stress UspA family protein